MELLRLGGGTQTEATRECNCCRSEISIDAAKCASCGEWREDIKEERNRCYLWSFVALVPIAVFVYGKSHSWWPPVLSGSNRDVTLVERLAELAAILEKKGFDWNVFFTSPSGLAVIMVFALAVGLSLRYYVSVSRKTGNWIWL